MPVARADDRSSSELAVGMMIIDDEVHVIGPADPVVVPIGALRRLEVGLESVQPCGE